MAVTALGMTSLPHSNQTLQPKRISLAFINILPHGDQSMQQ
ncbi:hypothetical protein T05_8206 [Trichinella murrelli]|uniref:Uncharacterized protein n=1 Tax=Trichinella murrelli TaxID=144512 RepID=A0A0V0SQU0_9BILA|nr:hypothetical protein T05_8206 [Trichinella murrelli]